MELRVLILASFSFVSCPELGLQTFPGRVALLQDFLTGLKSLGLKEFFVVCKMQAVVVYNLSIFFWDNDKEDKVKVGRRNKGEIGKGRGRDDHPPGLPVIPNLRLQQVMPISKAARAGVRPRACKKDDGKLAIEGESGDAGVSKTKARWILETMKDFGTRAVDKVRLANYRGMSRRVRNGARATLARLGGSYVPQPYEKMPEEDQDFGFYDMEKGSPFPIWSTVSEVKAEADEVGGQDVKIQRKSSIRRSFKKVLKIKNLLA